MKCKLQNTSNNNESIWIEKQDALIASLNLQPLIIVLRPEAQDFQSHFKNTPLFSRIKILYKAGIKHIEIAWSNEPRWIDIIQETRDHFPKILLGAASITSSIALDKVVKAGLSYSMSPVWDEELQNQARKINQVLVPGVFSPSEINKAISYGHKLLKFFPASTLGLNYLQQLHGPIDRMPFIIAAGGIIAKDIKSWLDTGHDAVALGRCLIKGEKIDPELHKWLQQNTVNL